MKDFVAALNGVISDFTKSCSFVFLLFALAGVLSLVLLLWPL